jgi:hypothetical protein
MKSSTGYDAMKRQGICKMYEDAADLTHHPILILEYIEGMHSNDRKKNVVGTVVHAYNVSYSGGGDWEDHGLRAVRAKR